MDGIGSRVQDQIRRVCPGVLQRDIAAAVGMTPDAFSRALNGKRGFSSVELARLADFLDADIHFLITGEPDPNRLVVAARHNFDHATGRREVPGRDGDEQVLQDIALAYRQSGPVPAQTQVLPASAAAVRGVLGDDFVRPFADRLEDRLGIDVARVAGISTAYSFTLAGRRVIVLPATGNWFWENWSLAHETGHLVHAHHDEGLGQADRDRHEAEANAFAADLLLPEGLLAAVDWDRLDAPGLAEIIWQLGVSTEALANRLRALTGQTPAVVRTWAHQPTQRLLRRHWPARHGIDEITDRMDAAARRRFPRELQEAHLEKIAAGSLTHGTLAWMLGVEPDALEVDSPVVPEVSVSELAEALGF